MNETLQNMFRNVTDQVSQLVGGYLPNLLGALGILIIGWLVALVVARVVRGALKRTTIDNRIAAWMGRVKRSRWNATRGGPPTGSSCCSSWWPSSKPST